MILNREKVLSKILPYKNELDKRNKVGIEMYRKGNFVLIFPKKVKNIQINQVKHKFYFGCTCFMLDSFEKKEKQEVFEKKFAHLFNQAVVPLYWSDLEPQEGRLRFSKDSEKIYRRPPIDICLEFCNKYDIEPKGHCLVWSWSNPKWLEKYDDENKKRLLEKRAKEISEQYSRIIPSFDIVNESASNYNYGRKFLFEGYDEFALKLGEKYFKTNRKIINETNDAIWRDYATEGKYCSFNYQLKDFISKDLLFDELGLQYHIFLKEEQIENGSDIFLNVNNILDVLELFNSYKYPMHISEITIPSYPGKIPENEDLQAELAEILYTTWFATENMKSIVWWNLVDGYAAYAPLGTEDGENYFCGGLLRFDMTEKPSYKILDKLINKEWKTNILEEINSDRYEFRGFFGEYDVTIDGIKYHINLDENGKIVKF